MRPQLATWFERHSPQSPEATFQRRAAWLVLFIAVTSLLIDGPKYDLSTNRWDMSTLLVTACTALTAGAALALISRGLLRLSGPLLLAQIALAAAATFVTGSVKAGLPTMMGGYCMAVMLAHNIAGQRPRRGTFGWPMAFSVIYVIAVCTRMVLRDGDVVDELSDFPFIVLIGPAFIYLVHTMAQRGQARVREALSESEAARAELDEANAKLRQRGASLHEALRVAELANQAKGRFLANMSHELRTPLNAILGYAAIISEEMDDLQGEEPPSASMRQDLTHIESAGRHLLDLISDILDLSRIEAGRSVLRFERVELDALFHELQVVMRPQVIKHRNAMRLELPSETPLWLETDLVKLRQVLFNLVGNAAKFTEQGTITLRCEATEDEALRFSVEDTGQGIALEHQEMLFEPFEQGDSSSTRDHGGAGLGLTLCKQLVTLLGGSISLQSTLGRGAVFSFELPRQPA